MVGRFLAIEVDGCQIGVEDWGMIRLKKPVLFISGPGWSRKLASFNDWDEANIFMTYLKHGIVAAAKEAKPTESPKS